MELKATVPPSSDFNPILHCISGSVSTANSLFGVGLGPITFTYTFCTGNEMKLIDCSHSMQPYYRCRDSSHAGVKCHARTGEMANWVRRIHVPLQVENEH